MNFRTSCVLPQPPIPITANIRCWPMRKSSPKKNCESWSSSLVLPTKLDDAVGQRGAGALLTSVGGGYALTVRLPCPLFVISPMLWENMAPPAESILEKCPPPSSGSGTTYAIGTRPDELRANVGDKLVGVDGRSSTPRCWVEDGGGWMGRKRGGTVGRADHRLCDLTSNSSACISVQLISG